MRIWLSSVAILVFPLQANAQAVEATEYYPLAVGNEWTYFQPYPGVDTLWDGTFGVDTLVVRDTAYFLARHPFSFSDTLRDDGNGRILARLNGREQVLFDFTAEDGASYQFERSPSGGDTFVVTVSRERTANVGAGRFEHCVSFYFDVAEALDDEHFWTFAPGVGIVKAGGFVGAYTELFSAIVGGKVITSDAAEKPNETSGIEVSAYPNPSLSRMTISLSRTRISETNATLFDVTGRRLVELLPSRCSLDGCVYELDRTDLPPGTYFISVTSEATRKTLPITLLR